jgi:hypothetical protein
MAAIINNITYQFADLELSLSAVGEPLSISDAFTELKYSDKVDRERQKGASRFTEDFTDGEYEPEGSVTFKQKMYDYIAAWLKEKGVGFYDVELTLTVNYRNKGQPVNTDTITKVKFASREKGGAAGPEGLSVPCDLFIGGRIYENGIGPFGEKL